MVADRWSLLLFVVATSQAFQSTRFVATHQGQLRRRRRQSHTTFGLHSTAPTSTSSLEKLTVKELRQLLKDNALMERGLSTRLKRKQDLVEYLQQNLPSSNNNQVQQQTKNGNEMKTNGMSSQKRPVRLQTMPELEETVEETSLQPYPPSANNKVVRLQQLYKRYPPLQDPNFCPQDGDEDVRQKYHAMLQNSSKSDMDIIFVGTASCTPGVTRGVSCTALRLNWRRRCNPTSDGATSIQETSFVGGTWLFDVGESTQLQVQRTTSVKPNKISKIFLTHAHGDHTFGLPGLLCLMGQDRYRASNGLPLDIYGPEGLRMWLRVAIRYSVARIIPPYRVHEIMDVPMAPEWTRNRRTNRYFYNLTYFDTEQQQEHQWGTKGLAGEDPTSWITLGNQLDLEPSIQYGELDGGRDIFPIYNHPKSRDGAPVWELEDEDDVRVYAAPMSHGVPCVGYVVEEQSRPGRLRNEYVEPIVRRNLSALRDAGFAIPMKAMAVIKNMPAGSSFTFPDGTVVTHEDAVEPPRQGRRVVICGDTADARAIAGLAEGADLLIHEATNAYLPFLDKDTSHREVTRDAKLHGHATPYMAGVFAKELGAKRLILNHFSARYKGDQSADSISIMTRIEEQAIKASGLSEDSVAAAWDLMILPIPQNQEPLVQ